MLGLPDSLQLARRYHTGPRPPKASKHSLGLESYTVIKNLARLTRVRISNLTGSSGAVRHEEVEYKIQSMNSPMFSPQFLTNL